MKRLYYILFICSFALTVFSQEIEWTIYNTSNSALPHNVIGTQITIDSDNGKWIPTWGGGLAYFHNDTWTIYDTSNSELPNGCNNTIGHYITIDKDDGKWIPTWGGGLAYFHNNNWTIYNTSNSGLVDDYVGHAQINQNNIVWMSLVVNGVMSFNLLTGAWIHYTQFNSPLIQNQIRDLFIDKDDNVWFGGAGLGISVFDGENWTTYNTTNSGLPDDGIRRIRQDLNDGSMWIATNNELARFDGENWQTWQISNSGIPSNYVISVLQTANGDIWVGTWDAGMARFDGENWTVYNTSNSPLPSNHVRALAQDLNGDIWIGTDQFGVAVLSGLYEPISQEEENEPLPPMEFLIFPNPTQDEVTLQISDSSFLGSKVVVYDMQGKISHTTQLTSLETKMNLGHLSSGMYSVEVHLPNGGITKRQKIVKTL
jgi:ligand-binding sensor domain-containing protein